MVSEHGGYSHLRTGFRAGVLQRGAEGTRSAAHRYSSSPVRVL